MEKASGSERRVGAKVATRGLTTFPSDAKYNTSSNLHLTNVCQTLTSSLFISGSFRGATDSKMDIQRHSEVVPRGSHSVPSSLQPFFHSTCGIWAAHYAKAHVPPEATAIRGQISQRCSTRPSRRLSLKCQRRRTPELVRASSLSTAMEPSSLSSSSCLASCNTVRGLVGEQAREGEREREREREREKGKESDLGHTHRERERGRGESMCV